MVTISLFYYYEKVFILTNIWMIGTNSIKSLGEYHDLYVRSGTLLSADVFENFRHMCLEIYELDPAIFLSAP